ncbi:hypothetical protein [Motiliproteus sediminis]|uniref:hypothetical protein n=1 Tax=Motiliproteus sediminis TaxID=1468178 RepID=UPI001AEF498E|nr:hypothetical protein [Motiliproteus sediminis]
MSQPLDQRYINIARACLNVLNNVNPALNRDQQISAVYDAIDAAINDLYKQQEQQLGQAFTALRAITRLDPEKHSVEDAIALARQVLPASH